MIQLSQYNLQQQLNLLSGQYIGHLLTSQVDYKQTPLIPSCLSCHDAASPLPHLKHARKESPSPSAWPQDIQTLPPTKMISDDKLQQYHLILQAELEEEEEISGVLKVLYHYTAFTRTISRSDNSDLTTLYQFMKNVQKQKQFIEMLRRAANSPWNREALEAVIFHGMCLCFRTDQVMNIIQMYSGLHPLCHGSRPCTIRCDDLGPGWAFGYFPPVSRNLVVSLS
jgi:hypothetical protein